MVFCVKYRRKLLRDADRINYLKSVCSEIGERYWFEFDAIGTDGDHVHIFVGAAPRYSTIKGDANSQTAAAHPAAELAGMRGAAA
jgi:putative transposase